MSSELQISCIIPFWNEGGNIFDVLDEVSAVKNLSEIICVDDASDDFNYSIIPVYYPGVKVIRLKRNLGKTGAVREGLRYASGNYILLVDADLRNLNHLEIENAIDAFSFANNMDMLILRRINAVLFVRLYRADVLFSGERMLRKNDLESILSNSDVTGWQLESAVNTWMFTNNKKVAWFAHSAINTHKYLKWGLFKGLRLDFKTYTDMVTATGFSNILKQILYFAKHELKPVQRRVPELAGKELEEVS